MVSYVFFGIYILYGLFRLPIVQLLVCVAVGAIVFGITESPESAIGSILLMNLVYPTLAKNIENDPFPNSDRRSRFSGIVAYRDRNRNAPSPSREGFMNTTPSDIAKRLAASRNPDGVGSPMSEGFEDADAEDMMLNRVSKNSKAVTAKSVPAPAEDDVEAYADADAEEEETEDFQDNSELFKLGEIPKDKKGGFHIDAGTTVINALKALKPDQINAMTKDTKSLIETQKSLMNMLQTFSPMVSEGKQMMDTFNTMFAPTAGS